MGAVTAEVASSSLVFPPSFQSLTPFVRPNRRTPVAKAGSILPMKLYIDDDVRPEAAWVCDRVLRTPARAPKANARRTPIANDWWAAYALSVWIS